ncbi:uncharacterized protein Mb2253c-like isoform X4 [Salvia splendens]|uniref:uncharacterized protein Mb2253c-like isoform X4 n=1 Tax=Salvia splendens TaxID=180675 RepID=UPI001C269B21|nr:uncharacterized protein Mb2253c-like isoform X4 [Salvia splendens]
MVCLKKLMSTSRHTDLRMLYILLMPVKCKMTVLANLSHALFENQILPQVNHLARIIKRRDRRWFLNSLYLSASLFQQDIVGSASFAANPQLKPSKLDDFLQGLPVSSYCSSCIIEFDGASKGNPGPAGAGAVLRSANGGMVFRLREGVGIVTNNVAEYRGAILGLRYALSKGFKYVRMQGDSKLVCMQVQGLWRTKTQNMADLCKVAKELKDQFASFEIRHVERECNTEADAQANLALHLKNGEIQVECDVK